MIKDTLLSLGCMDLPVTLGYKPSFATLCALCSDCLWPWPKLIHSKLQPTENSPLKSTQPHLLTSPTSACAVQLCSAHHLAIAESHM